MMTISTYPSAVQNDVQFSSSDTRMVYRLIYK